MKQISNEQFGCFLTTLRKEKQLTQKELARKLFVSDKTISKWERGMGMPNVALLLPIAEVFEISVTELLRGERLDYNNTMDVEEIETLVKDSLDYAHQHRLQQQKKKWNLLYLCCFIMTSIEIACLWIWGYSFEEMQDNVLLVCGLFLGIGGWFCLFAKELLPAYYDQNKINFISQGFCRIHMPGLSFHNGNWLYVLTAFRIWSLLVPIVYPLLAMIVLTQGSFDGWVKIQPYALSVVLGGMVISIYAIGKYYE